MKKMSEDYLKRWYFWATHSRLNPVIDTAKAINGHWNGVLNYINTRIDNGILEGINSRIQSAKDDARGFRTTKNFIITIYLRLGKTQVQSTHIKQRGAEESYKLRGNQYNRHSAVRLCIIENFWLISMCIKSNLMLNYC